MNYLAHIFLSGNDPLMRLGGFMADAAKAAYITTTPAYRDNMIIASSATITKNKTCCA